VVLAVACKAKESAAPPGPLTPTPASSEVHVDRRVELVSIAFRLAGAAEYSQATPTDYTRDVDKLPRDHPAIAATRELIAKGIAYDAPMTLAVNLDAPEQAAADDPRWKSIDVAAYVKQLRAYQADAKLDAFFAAHAGYYTAVESRVRGALEAERPAAWFESFFGSTGAHFVVVPGLLEGPANYGPHTADTRYQVLGLGEPDAQGLPVMTDDTVATLVHEMAHSFINPLFEAHASELVPSATILYRFVAKDMEDLKYGAPQIMLNESGVRAITVLYLRDKKGVGAAAQQTRLETRLGFLWTRELADVLAKSKTDVAPVAALFAALAKQYTEGGVPPRPFLGPTDAALEGDVVVLAPDRDDEATRYARAIQQKLFPRAAIDTAKANSLAQHARANLIVYGSPATNPIAAEVAERAGFTFADNELRAGSQRFTGPGLVVIACWPRPDDPQHGIVIYTAARDADIDSINSVRHGWTDWVVARKTAAGQYEVLARGDFVAGEDGRWSLQRR